MIEHVDHTGSKQLIIKTLIGHSGSDDLFVSLCQRPPHELLQQGPPIEMVRMIAGQPKGPHPEVEPDGLDTEVTVGVRPRLEKRRLGVENGSVEIENDGF